MTTLSNLSSAQLRHAAQIKDQIEQLQSELNRLTGGATNGGAPRGPRRMSAAARARIAAAQRARWAKVRGRRGPAKAARGPRRKMSAAAKARIAAAARARWAKAKAAGRNRL